MTQQFSLSREPTFLALLNRIQSRLTELHEGKDEEYKQQIALLEDARDKELLAVEAARGFALERIEKEYEEEKRLAEKEYQVPHLPPPALSRWGALLERS
jgi:Sds3-like